MAFVTLTIFANGEQRAVQFTTGSDTASVEKAITNALGKPVGTPFTMYRRGRTPRVVVAVNALVPAGEYDVEVVQTPSLWNDVCGWWQTAAPRRMPLGPAAAGVREPQHASSRFPGPGTGPVFPVSDAPCVRHPNVAVAEQSSAVSG